jgi:hypothetical protein
MWKDVLKRYALSERGTNVPWREAQDGRSSETIPGRLACSGSPRGSCLNGDTELTEEQRFLGLLEQIIALLELHEVRHWPARLADIAARFREAGATGEEWKRREALDELRGLYGGMGSFNDLVIGERGAPVTARLELAAINDELNALRRRLYRSLRKLEANGS